jgi:TRAP-type mannitol/chloroaromatic compound transport system substrate-binding protein
VALVCATLQSTAMAANADGPSVFWKMSLFGNARALTTGMATLSKKAAKETDGKFQIKIFPRVAKLIRIENLDGLKLNIRSSLMKWQNGTPFPKRQVCRDNMRSRAKANLC